MQTTTPKEFKLVALRECATAKLTCDTPEIVDTYWREQITQHPAYNPMVENFFVIFVNTRRRVIGHMHVSTGTLDTILVHPREVFRGAIIANAAAIIVGHNHPSGDSSPSEADIKVTRDLIRAGQLLKIEVLDHVINGSKEIGKGFASLRELGYFYS